MKNKFAAIVTLAFMLSLGQAYAQDFFSYEYSGTIGGLTYTSTVLTRVEKVGASLTFEDPEAMKVVVKGNFLSNNATKAFTATFCAKEADLKANAICTSGGDHFSMVENKLSQSGNFTAVLSGSICVSVPSGQTSVLPHPDVYFKIRQNNPRQDVVSSVQIKPSSKNKRIAHDVDHYEIPGCANKLELK